MTLSDDDIALLLEALDSHIYWQLSDPAFRSDGDVRDPGSDDPDQVAAITRCRDLSARLSRD